METKGRNSGDAVVRFHVYCSISFIRSTNLTTAQSVSRRTPLGFPRCWKLSWLRQAIRNEGSLLSIPSINFPVDRGSCPQAMDLRMILDQAVRGIKREVNLKVLKVPEIEQEVLDATSDEPWGPHGSSLATIAQGTRKFSHCQLIMNVLWSRLSETDQNWRHVYKALSVIEYLIANGSDRALNDIIDHNIQISSLLGFEHVDHDGKDVGINVRKKVETILALLDDKEKINSARDKAAATRDKYFGLSSTGITYKSNSTSFSSSDPCQYDYYGGTGKIRGSPKMKVVCKPKNHYAEGMGVSCASKSVAGRRDGVDHGRNKFSISSNTPKASTKQQLTSEPLGTKPIVDDDFDDFNPRASSTAGCNKVDPFADSLLIDWSDEPASIPSVTTPGNASMIDLFANSNPTSLSLAGVQAFSEPKQENADLFANQPEESSSKVDLFNVPNPNGASTTMETKHLQSPANSKSTSPSTQNSLGSKDEPVTFDNFTSYPDSGQPGNPEYSMIHSNSAEESSQSRSDESLRATFEVKSEIWADSLNRGLIDLNITEPKKVNLANIGIIRNPEDASDEKRKGHLDPGYSMRGITAAPGSSLDWSGFAASGNVGNLSQQQPHFDAFK